MAGNNEDGQDDPRWPFSGRLPGSLLCAAIPTACSAPGPGVPGRRGKLPNHGNHITHLSPSHAAMHMDTSIMNGHSSGAYLAASCTLQYPQQFQHLVLVCCVAWCISLGAQECSAWVWPSGNARETFGLKAALTHWSSLFHCKLHHACEMHKAASESSSLAYF